MSPDLTALIQSGQFVGLREWPGYGISTTGRVWSCWKNRGRLASGMGETWKEIRPTSGRCPRYPTIRLFRRGERFSKHLHILMLETFVGPRPQGLIACHFDDDRTNNRLENLRWDTPKNNCLDAARNGRQAEDWALGSRNNLAKLHENDIPEVRRLLNEGYTQKEVGLRFGVSHAAIGYIAEGKTWKHIT